MHVFDHCIGLPHDAVAATVGNRHIGDKSFQFVGAMQSLMPDVK
jgi:hypothetical protein